MCILLNRDSQDTVPKQEHKSPDLWEMMNVSTLSKYLKRSRKQSESHALVEVVVLSHALHTLLTDYIEVTGGG